MKMLYQALLVVGVIVGTLGGARLPEADKNVAAAGIAILIVAVILASRVRGAERRAAAEGGASGDDPALPDRMQQLSVALESLNNEAAGLELQALTERMTVLERDFFAPIAEASPKLLPVLGAEKFAHVFGTYASGERLVSRAWSAAVDNHREESLASLAQGTERIGQAYKSLGDRLPPEFP